MSLIVIKYRIQTRYVELKDETCKKYVEFIVGKSYIFIYNKVKNINKYFKFVIFMFFVIRVIIILVIIWDVLKIKY